MNLFDSNGYGVSPAAPMVDSVPSSWAAKVRAGMSGDESGSSTGAETNCSAQTASPIPAGSLGHVTHSGIVHGIGLGVGSPQSAAAVPAGNGTIVSPFGSRNGADVGLSLPVAGMGLGNVGHYSPLGLGMGIGHGVGASVGLPAPPLVLSASAMDISMGNGGGGGAMSLSLARRPFDESPVAALNGSLDGSGRDAMDNGGGGSSSSHSRNGASAGAGSGIGTGGGSGIGAGFDGAGEGGLSKDELLGAFPCVRME
ncbi:unnamed protein product, partial [Phaeothamnion confervicola]